MCVAMELCVFREAPETNVTIAVPPTAGFSHVISVLRSQLQDPHVVSFEYVDDDDDRIIVRNDEDLQAVFCYYSSLLEDSVRQGFPPPPLQVYPRLSDPDPHDLVPTWETNRHSTGSMEHPTSASSDFVPSLDTASTINSSLASAGGEDFSLASVEGSITQADVYFLGEMGHGSSGRVIRALHKPSQCVIAIKTIDLELSEYIQKQIISELSILKKCQSPYIIGFYGAFFVGSCIHVCTEFMDGHSLDRYGPVPETILGRIAVHVINGLVYLWQNKIMHRDVKPSNILINSRGEAKLCDFGVSIQLVESIANTYTGTCAYMAPERLKGAEYRVASDVWSLGVSLFELGSGRLPFLLPGESFPGGHPPANLLMERIVGMIEPPSLVAMANLSGEMDSFVRGCLDKNPDNRLSSSSMLEHAFYCRYNDHNNASIARWLIEIMQP